MKKIKVLFVCDDNSLRSQMAEAWLNHLGAERFSAISAGFMPGKLNPLGVQAMKEVGIDISGYKTKSVFELYTQGGLFSYVIALCDSKTAERCPIFPGVTRTTNWDYQDPSQEAIPEKEKLKRIRQIRDDLRERIERFIQLSTPEKKK